MKDIVELRVGSAGAGVFIGCGAGVGILTPISLHSIPVVGQITSSLSASFRQIDAALGGRLRSVMNSRNANVFGISAGAGCGVAVGFGYGAGLFLKPSALTSLTEALKSRIPPAVLKRIESSNNRSGGGGGGSIVTDTSAAAAEHAVLSSLSSPPAAIQSSTTSSSQNQLEKEVAELTKIVLRQQIALETVQSQLDALLMEEEEEEGGVDKTTVVKKKTKKR